jgi:RimJ/RimL family protein N-acetyltransferase
MVFRLRPWQDADAFVAAELANSGICCYMSDGFPGNNVEKWKKFIRNSNVNPLAFYRVIEVEGKFAGSIGVLICNDILRMNAELGYWIGEQYKGRGIMTQAIKELVRLVFDNFEITRIFATPFGNNFASQRVLEKAGFTLEGVFENVYVKNGIKLDELVYAIRK